MLSCTLLDELGYLPIDKHGADLLFQILRRPANYAEWVPDDLIFSARLRAVGPVPFGI